MAERANLERELFNAALERTTPEHRAAFLDGACGSDAALRARVEALLRAAEDGDEFLAEATVPPDTPAAKVQPGTRIDRYKLLERIGEGGFGVVYMAEQEEPVRRRVALKIVKPGMDTRAVAARFEAERQALAMMDHPNIAKVLDGGETASGRPYFVMELVRGVSITTFCTEQRLPTRERIQLFIRVCHAIQHAHQKGIIHRDLKPSNILVTLHDDRPVPKVIDFGIAKATDVRLTDKTLFTRFHQFVGTPSYMSPEQTGISGLDVDTRSDIYSLGVLLYELLTDRTPFDAKALLAGGFEEVHRVIREKDPPTPSRRLASLSVDEQTDAAQRRRQDRATLTSQLRGDLDVIVMKCLEKDRTRRYETASGLAADLNRHLNDEPVLARPPSATYRMTKFVRRHRAPVAFASLILVALVAGLAGTLTQARRATRHAAQADEQRDFALRQLSRAEAINDLNAFLLSDAAPAGKSFTVGELLARAEHILDRDQGDTVENRVEILVALGRQYQSLDEDAKARRLLTKAFELSRPLTDRGLRAKAARAYSGAIARTGEFAQAEALIQAALAELGDEPHFALPRIFCLVRGSYVARESGDSRTALLRIQAAEQLLAASPGTSALQRVRVAIEVAECYRAASRHREAVVRFEQAFAQLKALGRDDTDRAATVLNNWGLSVQNLGRPLAAEQLFRRAIEIGSVEGGEESVSPMLLNNYARVLFQLHRLPEATAYAERAYAKAIRAGDEIVRNQSLNVRAAIYGEAGALDQADAVLAELEPRWRRMMPAGHIAFTSLALHQAQLALARGDAVRALAEIDRAIALPKSGTHALDFAPLLRYRRAHVLLQLGRLAEAKTEAEHALRLWRESVEPHSPSSLVGQAHLLLGQILAAQDKSEQADAAFAAAAIQLEPTVGPDHPHTREALRRRTAAR
jgi:serine/threonine protein kinase/tetratricopeptide (TPR) repeat protein